MGLPARVVVTVARRVVMIAARVNFIFGVGCVVVD